MPSKSIAESGMYDNATKESARCWCWNQVCQRVPKGSTVMVLIGDTDAELRESQKRGMVAIGVDRNNDCVKMFRKSGGVAINDDFLVQMKNIKPDAVILDGVSGYTKYAREFVAAASHYTRAIVWNGLRGRDSHSKEGKEIYESFEIRVFKKGRAVAKRQPGIHRAMLLYASYFYEEIAGIHEYCNISYPKEIETECGEFLYCVATMGEEIMYSNKPEFMTYRSKDSGQYFDSGAWSTMLPIGRLDNSRHGTKASVRKAAAAKAVVTMRNR